MIVSAWIALNLAFFLICVSAIFELRARGKEIELLRQAVKYDNAMIAAQREWIANMEGDRNVMEN